MDRISARTAQDLMNPHFASARPDEQLDNVLDRMLEHDIEDLTVLDVQRQLVGAISLTTVLQAAADMSCNTMGTRRSDYSARKASTGSSRAARRAGSTPEAISVTKLTSKAATTKRAGV